MDREEQRLALVCGLDDPVRRRLYDYVSASGEPVGRDEAAAATGIGRPLAAYHLDRLVSLGLLTADYRRPGGRTGPGAGRPAKVYARSGSEFAVTMPPREYELAARLLAEAVESEPSGSALAGLRRAARGLGSHIGRTDRGRRARGGRRPSPREIMQAALAEHGFEPVNDADSITLRNCPFHQLAAQHRDVVCAMNLALLEGVAAGVGGRDLYPVLDPAPGRCCVVVRAGRNRTGEPKPMERHDA
jgi:predicted ArsR family transcriptional regulator